jgi:hypothetical protein
MLEQYSSYYFGPLMDFNVVVREQYGMSDNKQCIGEAKRSRKEDNTTK